MITEHIFDFDFCWLYILQWYVTLFKKGKKISNAYTMTDSTHVAVV